METMIKSFENYVNGGSYDSHEETHRYEAEVKEKMNPHPLKPTYHGPKKTRQELVDFWGLEASDVEWYRLYEIIGGKKVRL